MNVAYPLRSWVEGEIELLGGEATDALLSEAPGPGSGAEELPRRNGFEG